MKFISRDGGGGGGLGHRHRHLLFLILATLQLDFHCGGRAAVMRRDGGGTAASTRRIESSWIRHFTKISANACNELRADLPTANYFVCALHTTAERESNEYGRNECRSWFTSYSDVAPKIGYFLYSDRRQKYKKKRRQSQLQCALNNNKTLRIELHSNCNNANMMNAQVQFTISHKCKL